MENSEAQDSQLGQVTKSDVQGALKGWRGPLWIEVTIEQP